MKVQNRRMKGWTDGQPENIMGPLLGRTHQNQRQLAQNNVHHETRTTDKETEGSGKILKIKKGAQIEKLK